LQRKAGGKLEVLDVLEVLEVLEAQLQFSLRTLRTSSTLIP
jgi:hypothetical protein